MFFELTSLLRDKIIKYRYNFALIIIFLVSFFLRLYRLGYHDLWYDEVGTVGYAQYPWSNWNAPLYWILLHFWIKIFGISEFSLRFPSLLFSFFSVILVFLLGSNLFNKKIGIVASLFIGLSPFHLWYAQEARDYSMVLFFGTLSSYLLFKAIKERKFKSWLFFILISIIGLYTNYFYIFLFLAQFLYLLFFFRNLRLNFKEIICFLIIALSFSPYLPRFLSKFHNVRGGFWVPEPEWKSLIITLENFMLGYNGFLFLYIIADILMVIFLINAFWTMYKKNDLRPGFVFCIFLFFIPLACAFLFSKVFFSVYLDRGLIIFSPYFFLILSLGLFFLNRRIRRILFVILIILFFIVDYGYFKDWMFMPFIHHTGTFIKKPIRPVAKFLDNEVESHDIIAFTNESTMPSIAFYSQRKLQPFYYFFDPEFPDPSWQRPIQENEFCIPFYKINNLKFKRLWVVCSDWERSGDLDDNSRSVKKWLDENYKLEFVNLFDGLWVFRYVK